MPLLRERRASRAWRIRGRSPRWARAQPCHWWYAPV